MAPTGGQDQVEWQQATCGRVLGAGAKAQGRRRQVSTARQARWQLPCLLATARQGPLHMLCSYPEVYVQHKRTICSTDTHVSIFWHPLGSGTLAAAGAAAGARAQLLAFFACEGTAAPEREGVAVPELGSAQDMRQLLLAARARLRQPFCCGFMACVTRTPRSWCRLCEA